MVLRWWRVSIVDNAYNGHVFAVEGNNSNEALQAARLRFKLERGYLPMRSQVAQVKLMTYAA